MHTSILVVIGFFLGQADNATKVDLGKQIVDFAKGNLGKQVGNGECSALAEAALKANGAKNPGNYQWGELVWSLDIEKDQRKNTGKFKEIRPGDIIQFEDVRIQGKTPNGGTYSKTIPHHTAIIIRVNANNRTMQLLHQNSNGRRFVVEDNITIEDAKTGNIRVFHPIPR